MARLLIVYGTTEGHTALVARRLAEVIQQEGCDVELHESKEIRGTTLKGPFDGVLIGGSVHAGDHQSSLREFVKHNREMLGATPSAFFSVSLAAAEVDAEASGEAQVAVDKFIRETGWHPERVELIAGALVYTQYNLFIRHLMKLIAKHEGRTELDTSRDYDFTDWDAVERFGRSFAQRLRQNAAA